MFWAGSHHRAVLQAHHSIVMAAFVLDSAHLFGATLAQRSGLLNKQLKMTMVPACNSPQW